MMCAFGTVGQPASDQPTMEYHGVMPKSVRLSTPRPSPEEMARRLRIPKRRQRELNVLAEEYVKRLRAEKDAGESVIGRKEKPTNASAAD